MFLQERLHQAEQLDNFELSGPALGRTLLELQRINSLFGNVRTLSGAVMETIESLGLSSVKIVDLGCGSGDVLAAIARKAGRKGITVELLGIDGNANSLAFGQECWSTYPNLEFLAADILSDTFMLPPCDILISSHFLYHFPDEELVTFLNKHLQTVSHAAIFSELDRHFLALHLFKFVSLLLGFSPITRKDGQTAVRRAFRQEELAQIVDQLEFTNSRLQYKWAFRHLLSIYK